jgi:spore coat polysaccharide biosynthesis protein SpsF
LEDESFQERRELLRRDGGVMAFLQARMGSTRLPGKVLMSLNGHSILERAVRRLQASPAVDVTVVLTTTCKDDDVVAAEARRLDVPCHRGPELDVLKRFQEASRVFRPEIIIRATADNPLIEIGSIGRIVTALRVFDLDYCAENGLPYGAATEAVTAAALEQSHLQAREARHREHVTLHIKEHPEIFSASYLEPPASVRKPDLRVTVDTQEDFAFMERLLGLFPDSDVTRPLEDYINA